MSVENLHPQPVFSDTWNPQVRNQLISKVAHVDALLHEQGLEPDKVLFAGYSPSIPKHAGAADEHHHADGTYDYYFGSHNSLVPAALGTDIESAEDALYGNPLQFASAEGHVLGVFDAAQLAPYITETDDEVGNYIVTTTPEVVAAAVITEINLNQ